MRPQIRSRRQSYVQATVEFYQRLETSARTEIVFVGENLWCAGWDLYGNRPDKSWSLTDCISFVVMDRRGIRDALTNDRHFEQAGFKALLRTSG